MALERYNGSGSGGTKVPTGYAEQIVMNDSTFRAKRRELEAELHPPAAKKLKREKRGDSSIASGAGAYRGPWARWEAHAPDAIEGEDEELEVEVVSASEYEEDAIQAQPAAPKGLAGTAYSEAPEGAETTELFGELYDYQGRSYLHVPTSLGINLRSDEPQKSYHPKKLLHTWKKHTKAITQTRFFPGSGHLLLSASADSKIFLWDVYNERECLRGFYGHNRMVNDIDFEPDGRGFFSAGYDRKIKRWDTETGACTWKYSGTALAHCVRVKHSEPNMFLAGMSNNKILEFDTRAPGEKPEREYDHHLGPVNTITYWDEDRRFMSTSDDKSLRVWEWGFNVPSKIIAEPHMFAMTRAASHPSGKYGESLCSCSSGSQVAN